ncbi:MAG: hypothetical protein KF862_13155 [Chitinophagaceae bacterium]|nr:hypothetical protein [Chitinophagaceae bacterium]
MNVLNGIINNAARLSDLSQPGIALIALFEKANDPTKQAGIEHTFLLFSKVIQLVDGLSLTDKEMQYFILHPADFEQLNISKLPINTSVTPGDTQALFKALIRLLNYVKLRSEIAGGSDELIDVFATSTLTYNQDLDSAATATKHLTTLHQQIANLTRRDISFVNTAAKMIGITATAQEVNGEFVVNAKAFANERDITALWRLLQVLQTFGVPIETIAEAVQITKAGLTEEKCQQIAEHIKNAVKARYETEDWQKIAQPVFDRLRQRRRNALVAYLLHQYPNLFGSLEEMYEYFLLDPGTEPVVQTSRIRIATASVQLFIQRCLLNLETRWDKKVLPTVINASHWQWMNRYRVWEANRKIFLWPENWLEPEWRDDKTHLFKEMEGKLLQGDVSKELVEDAFFAYLKKLEELAKLDIVAMHCEEGELSADDSILHVLGRTHGIPHKYFYRKYSHRMWTPWEPVDTEIDGDHIVTTVWHNRFHIFWVTFIEKIPANNAPSVTSNSSTTLSGWKVSEALSTVTVGAQKKIIEAHLHWSDYYQGEWSTKQSGGFDKPVSAEVSIGTTSKNIFVSLTREPDVDGIEGALHINLTGLGHAYRVVNKNSPPEIIPVDGITFWPYMAADNGTGMEINRLVNKLANNNLAARYQQKIQTLNGEIQATESNAQVILTTNRNFSVVPCNIPVPVTNNKDDDDDNRQFAALLTPFFYQDDAHVFYVEPALSKTKTVTEWDEWVARPPFIYHRPPIDVEPYHPWPKDVNIPPLIGNKPFIDPADPRIKVTPKIRTDWATSPDTYIKFDQRVIGTSTGMNVLVTKGTSNGATILVKENEQLNHIIHNNSGLQDVVLVPADGTLQATETNISAGSNVIRNNESAVNTAILIGGGGITATSQQLNSQHLGGIFSNSIPSIKTFNRFIQ